VALDLLAGYGCFVGVKLEHVTQGVSSPIEKEENKLHDNEAYAEEHY
jgi:hypothetical protein